MHVLKETIVNFSWVPLIAILGSLKPLPLCITLELFLTFCKNYEKGQRPNY